MQELSSSNKRREATVGLSGGRSAGLPTKKTEKMRFFARHQQYDFWRRLRPQRKTLASEGEEEWFDFYSNAFTANVQAE